MPKNEILLMAGTAKGLFIVRGGNGKWSLDGPHFAGRAVYSAFFDQRKKRNEMWAGPVSWHFGAELVRSTDMGKTWDEPDERRIKMPKTTKKSLENIWQIAPGGNDDSLYVGVAPAALFESHDRGATWSLNKGLWNHPHRKKWTPGFGGLAAHTIITDKKNPNDIKIAISTGGVYQSADGGENWKVTNTGVKAYFPAESVSRIRAVRAQDRASSEKEEHVLSAKPSRSLPKPRRRRNLAGDRRRPAIEFRLWLDG